MENWHQAVVRHMISNPALRMHLVALERVMDLRMGKVVVQKNGSDICCQLAWHVTAGSHSNPVLQLAHNIKPEQLASILQPQHIQPHPSSNNPAGSFPFMSNHHYPSGAPAPPLEAGGHTHPCTSHNKHFVPFVCNSATIDGLTFQVDVPLFASMPSGASSSDSCCTARSVIVDLLLQLSGNSIMEHCVSWYTMLLEKILTELNKLRIYRAAIQEWESNIEYTKAVRCSTWLHISARSLIDHLVIG